jgi:hypothetical protein
VSVMPSVYATVEECELPPACRRLQPVRERIHNKQDSEQVFD